MLQTMTGLPPGVLGFEINGALHATTTARCSSRGRGGDPTRRDDPHRAGVRALRRVVGRGPGAGPQAGVEHLTHWQRIALVTDIDWMTHLTALFGWMTPGELKHFPLAERDAAIAWAAAKT
jgi:SpoIIAA-like